MKLQRRLYPLHSWLGLSLALVIFVLCVSGSSSMFKDEFERWVTAIVADPSPAMSPDEALVKLLAAIKNGQAPRRLELPIGEQGYELRSQGGERYRLNAQGEVVPVVHSKGIADFLVNYHTRLFMGKRGRWLIGVVGVLLLVSIISGVLMHRRFFRQLFTLRRRRANVRLAYADTHKLAGAWGFPFHLLIGLTGAWLGLYSLISPDWQTPAPEHGAIEACELPVSLECALKETRQAIPGFSPVFVDFGKDGSAIAVRGNLPGRLFRRHEAGAVFESSTGRPLGLDAPQQVTMARRLDLATAPLHFGDFAGIAVKCLYAFLGLLGATLAVTGVLMWGRRGSARAQARRQNITRVFCALAGGNLVATLALPLLAVVAATGMVGSLFPGSMRLSDLFSEDVAPILPIFLLIWLISAAGLMALARLSSIIKIAIGVSGLGVAIAPLVAALQRYRAGLDTSDVLLHPMTLVLLALGLAMIGFIGHVGRRARKGVLSADALFREP